MHLRLLVIFFIFTAVSVIIAGNTGNTVELKTDNDSKTIDIETNDETKLSSKSTINPTSEIIIPSSSSITPAPITISTISNKTTSTSKPTTTTSTSKPNTTTSTSKPTTTTSTSKPTTTTSTSKPTTTTSTSKPTTTTSTSKPTTTTKPAPKPTPPPANLSAGLWSVNYTNTNISCIVLHIATEIELKFKIGNNTKNVTINVPQNAKAIGNCNSTLNEQMIKLIWELESQYQNITFTFRKNSTTNQFHVDSIIVQLNISLNNWAKVILSHTRKNEFNTPLMKSYKCEKEQTLDITNEKSLEAFLHVSLVQIEAFRNTTGIKFNEAIDCIDNGTPDAVPIAVGCALIVLIVIVLVGYLIGRKRSQAHGYLSM